MKYFICLLAAVAFTACNNCTVDKTSENGTESLKLPAIFGDHMVLQRNEEISVWGWCNPGMEVTASIAGNDVKTTADKDGKWSLKLPKLKAGGPYELTVKADTTLTIKDVLVGDVWVCSGQSNMEWPLYATQNSKEEINKANLPNIRFIKVKKIPCPFPVDDISGEWKVCSPQTVSSCTAVGYYFGKEINKTQGIPVGLISSNWGGTRVEPWMSYPTAKKLKGDNWMVKQRKLVDNFLDMNRDIFRMERDRFLKAERELARLEKDKEHQKAYAAPTLDDSEWKFINTPDLWDNQGYKGHFGEAWYRKTIEIPESWAGKDLLISPGAVDEIEATFFNGQKVGSRGSFKPFVTKYWNKSRVYKIPADLVKPGKNVIAVKVVNIVGGGGMFSNKNPKDMYIKPADKSESPIALSGKWRFKFAFKLPEFSTKGVNHATVSALYNGMIHPIVQYPITGAIWYQGESNASNAYEYRNLFPAMIKDWRELWGKEFPFFWVQLANFKQPKKQPKADNWAIVRESQNSALKLPNTATALAIDIGEANDIHPRNKKDVGYRLSLGARAIHYGEKDLVYSGPFYKSMKIEGSKIRVSFDHVNGGLVAKGGELKRFAIAGKDKKFYWATAKIDGDTVVISSEKVKAPIAVRYAFEINPEGCNLYNKAGLPASPFRTDNWKVPTQK